MREVRQPHERQIQRKVLNYLSNPAEVYETVSGKRLQILSPGKINKFQGPDFKNIAIMIDGDIHIGNGEFHRSSKDWIAHNHDNNRDYDDLVLHIVFDYTGEPSELETLVLPEEPVMGVPQNEIIHVDLSSIEDLQHFALMRLLRKSSEIQVILNNNTLLYTVRESVRNFLERYFARRRRPVYTTDLLSDIIDSIESSLAFRFLMDLEEGDTDLILDKLQVVMKNKIAGEGAALRREILLNCILPISLCLAEDEARVNLLFWFWSTPTLNNYGHLNNRFPEIPQNFIWQQQGMLEYLKHHGNKTEFSPDASKRYGFAKVLGFYKGQR